jgi:hypothetical protein
MDAACTGRQWNRDNDLTVAATVFLRISRVPLVRYHPGYVAGTIRAALRPGAGIQIPA